MCKENKNMHYNFLLLLLDIYDDLHYRQSSETPFVTTSSSRASSVSTLTPGSTTDEKYGHSSCSAWAVSSTHTTDSKTTCISASIEETLLSDYNVHELPSHSKSKESGIALAARVEYLKAKTKYLRNDLDTQKAPLLFRIEQIVENDSHIKFYTGFTSYVVFLNTFEFLGPAVHRLNYWGDTERKTTWMRKNAALTPLNQYFLTLVKLQLNLQVKDLVHRFRISTGLVSKYFITWICSMYHHLKEIGHHLWNKWLLLCHKHFKTDTRQLIASLIEVKFLLKLRQIYSCSRVRGLTTSTQIPY